MAPHHRQAIKDARLAGEAKKPKEVREAQNQKIGASVKRTRAEKRAKKGG